MPAQNLTPIRIITVPLALRSSGDTAAFTEAAERNVQDMHKMGTDINEKLIPAINAAVDPLNTLMDNLPAVQNAAANADTAIQKAAAAAGSATAAAGSATAANTAKTEAETAKTEAQTAKTGAESAKTEANTAKTGAEAAKTEAQTAQIGSERAKTEAERAKTEAETAKTEAQTAETNANASKNAAAGSATAAAGSATAANTAKTGAEAAKVEAEAARDAAQNIVTGGIPDASTTVKGLVKYGAAAGTAAQGNHTHAAPTTITGNAGSATKLKTARAITLTGDVTGSVSFDGSANASMETVIAGGGGATVVSTPVITIGANVPVGLTTKFSVSAISLLSPAQVVNAFTWGVAELGITDKDIAASAGNAEISLSIPAGTAVGRQLTIKVVARDALGNASRSASVKTTVSAAYVIPPTFVVPAGGASIQPKDVTWITGAFKTLGVDDVHMASRYKILNNAGTQVYDSGEITAASGLTTWTAAAPTVTGGTNRMQAAYKGKILGWSAFGEVNVHVVGVKKPSIISPTANASISHYYLTMGTSAFALDATGVPDTHVASRYRIRSQDGQTVLYDSGEVADLVRHVIVGLNVAGGTVVQMDAVHKGTKLGWSAWSAAVNVTIVDVAQYDNTVEYLTAGNYNFVVPDDITKLRVLVVGGGSGGGAAGMHGAGGNGGNGGGIVSAYLNVTPGAVIPLSVGAVGAVGTAGGGSTFGAYITSNGGTSAAHGVGTTNFLPAVGTVICNLNQTPCTTFKSCKSFKEMALNDWKYDTTYTNGNPSSDGNAGGSGSLSTYGIGGNGGYGTNNQQWGGIGGDGGKGGNGGGKGGIGGDGGMAAGGYKSGIGGDGGDGGGIGGKGGNGGVNFSSNSGGRPGGDGGNSGYYGGIGGDGGNGGSGVDSSSGAGGGKGSSGGIGGNGGNGGNSPYGKSAYGIGGSGGNGGKGCVVVFF